MTENNLHYQKLVEKGSYTTFASCGFSDRFDPFILNKEPCLRQLYGSLFKDFLSDRKNERLLDIGCGTGIYFDMLADYASMIDAIDCSGDMIDVAQNYCEKSNLHHIHPQKGTSEDLPFSDNAFDIVISMDTLHHVEDLEKTLAEISRVLKPEGVFFVFEPNILNPLMFFAHLIPAEERLALKRNMPKKLCTLLENQFDSVKWEGICGMITQTRGLKRVVLDTYLKCCEITGVKKMYPRQAWLGTKKQI